MFNKLTDSFFGNGYSTKSAQDFHEQLASQLSSRPWTPLDSFTSSKIPKICFLNQGFKKTRQLATDTEKVVGAKVAT
jgi:hypothetical protein